MSFSKLMVLKWVSKECFWIDFKSQEYDGKSDFDWVAKPSADQSKCQPQSSFQMEKKDFELQ